MKVRVLLLVVPLFLLTSIIFNIFDANGLTKLALTILSFSMVLLYLNIREKKELVISKNLIFEKFKRKNISGHYVIFLEMTNLLVYSQFYDIYLGDQMLKQVYKQLVKSYGKKQVHLYSTNQLVIILEFQNKDIVQHSLRHQEQCQNTKVILEEIYSLPFTIRKKKQEFSISLTAGSGAVGIKNDINCFKEIIRLAHFTMLRAKNEKQEFLVANEEIHAIKQDLDSFNLEIDNGVKLDEFSPFFLPIFDVRTNRIVGCESLVRWQKSKYRIIEASKFKEIALEKKLFKVIDKRVIEKTFIAFHLWKKKNLLSSNFRITLNLSLNSLFSLSPFELVELASIYNIQPSSVEFDISEEDISSQKAIGAIKKLKQSGFRVSIDAFNSSNSSLKSLLSSDFDILKIDKSHLPVGNIGDKEYLFYRMVNTLAQSMNLKVMLKGIENRDHLKFAQTLEVDYAQGYYFTKPLDETQIAIFLEKYKNGILTPR